MNSHLGSQNRREDVADAGNLAVEVILRSQVGPGAAGRGGRGGRPTAVLPVCQRGPDGAVNESLVFRVDCGAESDGGSDLLGVLEEQHRRGHGRASNRH